MVLLPHPQQQQPQQQQQQQQQPQQQQHLTPVQQETAEGNGILLENLEHMIIAQECQDPKQPKGKTPRKVGWLSEKLFCTVRFGEPLWPSAGLPFSRGFADFRENEVSESANKKQTNPRKKIRPNLFLKRQLKLTQTASKLQPRADDRILHLVFALRYEISHDQPVAIVF